MYAPHSWTSLPPPHPTPLGHHRALNWGFKGDGWMKLHGTRWLGGGCVSSQPCWPPSLCWVIWFPLGPLCSPSTGWAEGTEAEPDHTHVSLTSGALLTPGIPSLSVVFPWTAGHCQSAGLSQGEHPSNVACPPVLRVQLPHEVRSRPWAQDCTFKTYDLGLPLDNG